MAAKPSTVQACNTQACGPDCRGPDRYYNIRPYDSCGWAIWYTWDGVEIAYQQYGDWPWYRNIGAYQYYSTSSVCINGDDAPGWFNICRRPL